MSKKSFNNLHNPRDHRRNNNHYEPYQNAKRERHYKVNEFVSLRLGGGTWIVRKKESLTTEYWSTGDIHFSSWNDHVSDYTVENVKTGEKKNVKWEEIVRLDFKARLVAQSKYRGLIVGEKIGIL